jgi:nucleotide-binding universal stress UspA family protein
MKILCATDFTSCSDEAARAANAVTRQCNASLELVHVSPSVAGIFRTVEEDDYTDTASQGAWTRLHKRAESLAELGVPPACKLLTLARGESVPKALARYAAETAADMLVISTHGKSGSKIWPMGSLATSIVDTSLVPVMVVHEARPLSHWRERQGELLRVLVGLDLTEDSSKVLDVMKQFHLHQGARITAGYVQQLFPMGESMWQVAPIIPVWNPEDDALHEKQLRELMASQFDNLEIRVMALSGYTNPAHRLVEMAAEEHCDILVIGTHQRNAVARLLFGSVSHGVLRESKTNLLFVPLKQPKTNADGVPPVASALGKHIFCATDFTHRSGAAALAAQELAIRFGSTFEIAHVLEDYISWPGLPVEALRNIKEGAQTRLKQFSMDLSARGLSPKKTLIEAKEHEPIADCVLEYLQAHRPLLAVISSHGKSAGSWWPLGSTALKIAENSPVPVLVVKSSEAFQSWLESGRKLHVLGAVDAQGQAAGVLEWMKLLNEAGSCSFTLVHIDQSHGTDALPSPGGDPVPNHSEAAAVLEKGLLTLGRSVLGDQVELSVLVQQSWESIVAKLDEVARTSHADLIIVGAHQWHGIKRWFFESVFRGLIIKSDASILCLPVPHD